MENADPEDRLAGTVFLRNNGIHDIFRTAKVTAFAETPEPKIKFQSK